MAPGTSISERRRIQNRTAQQKFRDKKKATVANHSGTQDDRPDEHISQQNGLFSSLNEVEVAVPLSPPDAYLLDGATQIDGTDIIASPPDLTKQLATASPFNLDWISHDSALNSSLDFLLDGQISLTPSTEGSASATSGRSRAPSLPLYHPTSNLTMTGYTGARPAATVFQSPSHPDELPQKQSDWRHSLPATSAMEYGSNIGIGWKTPLHASAERGHLPIVRVLLEQGAERDKQDDAGCTALHLAVINKHRDVAQLLLDGNADANIMDGKGHTALYYAAELGFEDGVRLLIAHGASVNGPLVRP